MFQAHWNLLHIASHNVASNLRTYGVASLGLILPLVLLLSGVAISEGLKLDALAAVDAGADLYCTWDVFGRDAALPRDRMEALSEIAGVQRVVPRIIGRVRVADQFVMVIGLPPEVLSDERWPISGSAPRRSAEVLIGHELARAVGWRVGSRIVLDAQALRVFTVSGIVDRTSALYSSKAIMCGIDEAAIVFGEAGLVSDVCLYTRAGYEGLIAEEIGRIDARYRVQTKMLVRQYVGHGMTVREGIFSLMFALGLALAIPTFAVLTYQGSTPRRREIGLLRLTGWRVVDVLEMVVLENVIVSVLSAGVALLLSLIWVTVFRAPLVAPFLIADLPTFPEMDIPSRFAPLPAFLAVMFCVVVTMTGSVFSTWRTSLARPVEVLR